MKRKLMIASVVILSGVILIFQLRTGFIGTILKTGGNKDAASNSRPVDQGHSKDAGNSPDAKPGAQQEQTAEEAPTVEIPSDKQSMIGVKTTEVSVKPLQKVVRTVGLIEYDERKLATVNTKFEGWIEKLYVDYTGKYVKKGEPLAEIYSPELLATQKELLSAVKWAKNTPPSPPLAKGGNVEGVKSEIGGMLTRDAESIADASRQRLRLWDVTDAQIKKVEETGIPIRTLTVYSPVTGYIIQKAAVRGMKVMPGEKLFDVADLSTLWIVADIYEYELAMIKPGQKAKISLSYLPGKEFSSSVDFVYPSISSSTRTAKVRFEIPNREGRLKPQMYSNIEVKIDLGKKLSVPDDAVIDTGIRQIVYVDKGDGNFEPREVMLGVKAEGLREVLMGLKAGEKVASSATFLIDSEAQLKNVSPLGIEKRK